MAQFRRFHRNAMNTLQFQQAILDTLPLFTPDKVKETAQELKDAMALTDLELTAYENAMDTIDRAEALDKEMNARLVKLQEQEKLVSDRELMLPSQEKANIDLADKLNARDKEQDSREQGIRDGEKQLDEARRIHAENVKAHEARVAQIEDKEKALDKRQKALEIRELNLKKAQSWINSDSPVEDSPAKETTHDEQQQANELVPVCV